MSDADRVAIQALLNRLYEAWADGDGRAYANCFTECSDYVAFNGIHLRGRDENARMHDALLRNVLKDTRLSAQTESIDLLASGVALVHTSGAGPVRNGSANSKVKSVQTFVLVRGADGWRIRSFQNTRRRPFSIWLTSKLTGLQRPRLGHARP